MQPINMEITSKFYDDMMLESAQKVPEIDKQNGYITIWYKQCIWNGTRITFVEQVFFVGQNHF